LKRELSDFFSYNADPVTTTFVFRGFIIVWNPIQIQHIVIREKASQMEGVKNTKNKRFVG